ncbi:lipocalin family protein [bacterium]|nr:lipocalin family protein [candidate division CSSED10-310 bacterium]
MNRRSGHCIVLIGVGMIILGGSIVAAGHTDHIPVVTGFDIPRYLGVWYEIIRSDNSFERGLTHVTATYSLRNEGTFNVVNRGYKRKKGKWKTARAVGAYRPGSDRGEFRVTFFWPFGADYRIIELGSEYEYAVVTSHSIRYFWILSREPSLDPGLLDDILDRAKGWGFDTSGFIRVDHSDYGGMDTILTE